jgi:ribose 5-phosphate isomerase A
MTNSEKALEYIEDGALVGLGTGQAATDFIRLLGKKVAEGLSIHGVPTSGKSASLARELHIPLMTLEEAAEAAARKLESSPLVPDEGRFLDVTVDGADEVDRNLNLIKGLGGALVREKIVAAASRRLIILIGPKDVSLKDTGMLGKRGVLPVEVVPFGVALVVRRLAALGYHAAIRQKNSAERTPAGRTAEVGPEQGQPFETDNRNYILDCKVPPIAEPENLEQQLRAIPGVVGTGLFVGMASVVLIQDGDRLEIREAKR